MSNLSAIQRYLLRGGRLVQLEDTQELGFFEDFKQRIADDIKTIMYPSDEQKAALADLIKAKEDALIKAGATTEKLIEMQKEFLSLSPEEQKAKLIALAEAVKAKVAEKRVMALLEDDMEDDFYMFWVISIASKIIFYP